MEKKTFELPYKPDRAEALDYDGNNRFTILRQYFNLRYVEGRTGGRIYISPSGRGTHIYSTNGIPITVSDTLEDCTGRRVYWNRQGYTFTFKKRGSNGRVKGEEIEMNILSEPFWSQFPARKKITKKRGDKR